MTWDSMAGDWNESQTKVRQRWGRLTDEDLRRIAGKRAELVQVVAERYDIKRDQAESQVEDFEQSDDFETETETQPTGMGAASGRGMSGQARTNESGPSGGGESSSAQSSDTSREKTGKSADDEDEALNQPRRGAQEQGRSGGMRSEP